MVPLNPLQLCLFSLLHPMVMCTSAVHSIGAEAVLSLQHSGGGSGAEVVLFLGGSSARSISPFVQGDCRATVTGVKHRIGNEGCIVRILQ